MGQR
jgi:hypothetical protein